MKVKWRLLDVRTEAFFLIRKRTCNGIRSRKCKYCQTRIVESRDNAQVETVSRLPTYLAPTYTPSEILMAYRREW